jgi:hypothetical protein
VNDHAHAVSGALLWKDINEFGGLPAALADYRPHPDGRSLEAKSSRWKPSHLVAAT